MLRVTEAEYLGGFRLRLSFSDGATGVVDLQGRLDGPVFQPLNEPQAFRQFQLSDHTLVWPDGADLAPEYLHDLVTQGEPTNHPMQPSGEVGRLEVEDQPSPPVERQRYRKQE